MTATTEAPSVSQNSDLPMSNPVDPKRTTDSWGVLGEPRFIPELPPRSGGGSGRIDAVRPLMDAVRARPNTWAESAVRVNPDTKRNTLYVRYVGAGQQVGRRP